jgi:hypothetical protein
MPNASSISSQIKAIARAPSEQSADTASILHALTYVLQIAFEHAVFPNRFEIDEQEPLSRLEALTEQLLLAGNSLPHNGASEAEKVVIRTVIIPIICEASIRVRFALY